jgi:hypothetical protein
MNNRPETIAAKVDGRRERDFSPLKSCTSRETISLRSSNSRQCFATLEISILIQTIPRAPNPNIIAHAKVRYRGKRLAFFFLAITNSAASTYEERVNERIDSSGFAPLRLWPEKLPWIGKAQHKLHGPADTSNHPDAQGGPPFSS